MIEFERWRQRHPQAAAELTAILTAQVQPTVDPSAVGKSEAWAQQQDRFKIARAGALAFRNNNGATPAKCEKCGRRTTPVRYGLANDSAKLNEQLKSSDLILGIPRLIRPQDVGRTLLQFGSDEGQRRGWTRR